MYFCKNCGEPYMTDEAVMCVKCGVAKGQGNIPAWSIDYLGFTVPAVVERER